MYLLPSICTGYEDDIFFGSFGISGFGFVVSSMDWEYQEILLIKLVKQKGLHREDIAITPEERFNFWSEIAQRCMYSSAEETQIKWKSIRTEYEKDKSLLKYQHGILNFLDQMNITSKIEEPDNSQTESEYCPVKPSTSIESSSDITSLSDNTLNDKNDNVCVSSNNKVEIISSTVDCNDTEAMYSERDENVDSIHQENTETIQQLSTLNLENARDNLGIKMLEKRNAAKRKSQNSVISQNKEVDSNISTNDIINISTQRRKRKSQDISFDENQEIPKQVSKTKDNISSPLLSSVMDENNRSDTDPILLGKSNNLHDTNKETTPQHPLEMETNILIDDLDGKNNETTINKNKENNEVSENNAIDKSNNVHDINKESMQQNPIEMARNMLIHELNGTGISKIQEIIEDNEVVKKELFMKDDIDEMDNNSFYSTLSDLVCKLTKKQQKKLRLMIGTVIADAEIEMLKVKMPE
ncbi:hypothetical protein K1T71_005634 [Dendrolimus kikuchii]|uniref:Uncharacterized protein n=1 Tax=Dendrolimus kikuchii TaxID=765133 RepID=A0ACC1D4K2_9NEOP|nr:hypothetical protein K1T71_005634 [Dendrolimus kikuchii]